MDKRLLYIVIGIVAIALASLAIILPRIQVVESINEYPVDYLDLNYIKDIAGTQYNVTATITIGEIRRYRSVLGELKNKPIDKAITIYFNSSTTKDYRIVEALLGNESLFNEVKDTYLPSGTDYSYREEGGYRIWIWFDIRGYKTLVVSSNGDSLAYIWSSTNTTSNDIELAKKILYTARNPTRWFSSNTVLKKLMDSIESDTKKYINELLIINGRVHILVPESPMSITAVLFTGGYNRFTYKPVFYVISKSGEELSINYTGRRYIISSTLETLSSSGGYVLYRLDIEQTEIIS